MKTIVPSISILLLFSILNFSCKKVDGDNTKITQPNQPVKGYMSTTEGSWWMYASTEGEIFVRRATGIDSAKMGFVFNYYETQDTNTLAITPEYFAKNEDNYTMLVDMDGSMTNYIMAIVQKDNSIVGDSWTNSKSMTYSGLPVDLLIEGEVVAINQTITIAGTTLDNVTKVKNKLKAKTALTPYIDCGVVTMWFSKGIGVIKSDFDINVMSFYTRKHIDSLIKYNIEPDPE